MKYKYTVVVFAEHGGDAQKQAVSNALGSMTDADPNNTGYTADNWYKFSNGSSNAWGLAFYCTDQFKAVIDDFNAGAPTYPDIPADNATIDFARTFMTLDLVPRDISHDHKTARLDAVSSGKGYARNE